jgi:hypothetical protein
VSYVPVCVNSLGCGITGQHTVECLERMVSGLWEEQLRMQPVIDAARAWYATYAPVGPDDGAFHEDLALFDAVRALDAQEEE